MKKLSQNLEIIVKIYLLNENNIKNYYIEHKYDFLKIIHLITISFQMIL